VLDAYDAPAPVRLHPLGIEQLGQRPSVWLGRWPLCPLALRLVPIAEVCQESHRVVAIVIGQT
jgi:hypothetical protein